MSLQGLDPRAALREGSEPEDRGRMATRNAPQDTRYGQSSGSGANEPKRREKKEQRPDWIHQQGGNQTRPDTKPLPQDEVRNADTKGAQQTATMPHLEGAEQGPR
jgi:hypothetical protein